MSIATLSIHMIFFVSVKSRLNSSGVKLEENKVHLFEISASGFRVQTKGTSGYRTNFTTNVITTSLERAIELFNAAHEKDEKMVCIEIHQVQKRDRMSENFIIDPNVQIIES
jgi:hypothetical protein